MKNETIRHSLSHILAAAVEDLYPGTKFGIGSSIEKGFYYDFDLPKKITPEDLPKVEKKMRKIIKQNIVFKKEIITKNKAKNLFKNQPYKLELISKLPENKISVYKTEKFIDLCQGPHIKSSSQLYSGQLKEIADSFKLTKIAGAYWQGSEKNKMLIRIYGLAFKTKEELKEYLKFEEEARKRDHRFLGEKLDLFLFDEEVGSGLPIWQPKGTTLRKTIEKYLYKELTSQGYQWITSPHIGKLDLWKTSGHWRLYRENMYSPIEIEKEKYMIKPMNCPFHIKIFQSKIRSYKDLPIKYAEFGTVYRYEKSGTLHGLTRVRGFTQDDAHIWCTPQQISKEIASLLREGLKILKTFGFKDFEIYLSTRPKKYAGNLKEWGKATNALKEVLQKLNLKWQVDPGGGVFYGPKIDIKIKDSLGRSWQCTTIQVDFNLPERFKLNYINQKGEKEKVIMIHRALLGSFERFIGVLIEHYAGDLPFWLSPNQIWIIPIGKKHQKYAQKIKEDLSKNNFRTEIKAEDETVSKKIRNGEIQKIPYLLLVGDKELKRKKIRVRKRKKGDIGEMSLSKFIKKHAKNI